MNDIGIADHTSLQRGTWSDDWGTPETVLDLVRGLYGPIVLDLASSAEHNERVKAGWLYTTDYPCPDHPPMVNTQSAGVSVWCNPPGPRSVVEAFWNVWRWCAERTGAGGFLIYKQDHWRALPPPSFLCTCVVLRKRLRFHRSEAEVEFLRVEAERKGEKYKPAGGATFPSTLVLPGDVRDRVHPDHGHALLWGPQ